MSFDNLGLNAPILEALRNEGYTHPTPIQAQSIPAALQGKDILGIAQTGTGKTAAFAIPIIQRLSGEQLTHRKIRALILTPTRELAIQIGESFTVYGKGSRIWHTVIFGGVSQHAQTLALQKGVDVLIATPGRLLDLMQQRYISLKDLEVFVLDEADRMLDMGFIHDVKKVVAALPAQKQTLFFSATLPAEITHLAHNLLHHPVKVTVTPVASTVDLIEQSVYHVKRTNKKALLLHVMRSNKGKSALVFTRTKHGANKVTKDLVKAGFKADAIHGNKSQNSRQTALSNFKNGQIQILVATDIAARGIDVEELGLVINYELPNIPETYVHRIGRTGRAGAQGIAIAFCDEEERVFLRDIEKLTGKKIAVRNDHPEYAKETVIVDSTPNPTQKTQTAHSQSKSHPPKSKIPFWKKRKMNAGSR